MVKFRLVKRDFVWIGLIVVLMSVGFIYAAGNPGIFGHSGDDIAVTDSLCKAVTGHGCGIDVDTNTDTNGKTLCNNNLFLDGDGQCKSASQIVVAGGGMSSTCTCIGLYIDGNSATKSFDCWDTWTHTPNTFYTDKNRYLCTPGGSVIVEVIQDSSGSASTGP